MTHERDLLRALLDLNAQADVAAFLDEALALACSATGAQAAYLAVGPGFDSLTPRWSRAHALGDDALFDVRTRLSTALIAEASEVGLVRTIDASADPRFRNRPSVRANQIRGVLCAALQASGDAAVGVLYLVGPPAAGRFDDEAVALTRLLSLHLGPIAQRMLVAQRGDEPDPTQPLRARLVADDLVGHSAALARVLEAIGVAAAAPIPVLLTGPTGTGKSTIARVLHESSRPAGPFVSVNAAHLKPELALAELFGAKKGAYTGLEADRVGLVEAAEGGTLFLDEIVELPADVQAIMLTFLQDGTFRRVGETTTRRVKSIRIVSATNQSVEPGSNGKLRDDLLFRLATFRIDVPGLDARPEDVAPLAFALVDRAALRFQIRSRPLSAAACGWLESRSWPGNIRELDNVVQSGLLWAHSENAATIRTEHLLRDPGTTPMPETLDMKAAVARFKKAYAQRVLDEAGGNKSEAARRLGVHRSHLHDLLRTFETNA